MKKKVWMKMAAACVLGLALAGCGEEEKPAQNSAPVQTEAQPTAAQQETGSDAAETKTETAQVADASPQEIFDRIAQSYAVSDLILGDDDWILNNYGLEAAKLDGYVCAEGDETHADRVFIIKVADAADLADVQTKVGNMLEMLSSPEMLDYLPEQADIIKAASVKTKGNYVYLFLSADAAGMEQIFNEMVQ